MSSEAKNLLAKVLENKWSNKLTSEEISIIAKHPKSAKIYAQRVTGRRFSEAEPYIAQNACESYLYAKDVLHSKFLLGEPAIAKSAKYSLLYAKIFGRFAAGEQAILDEFLENNDHSYIFEYTSLTGKRFEQAEEKFASSAKISHDYAVNVLRHRFHPGERAISQDPDFSLSYAFRLIKVRWAEAEEQISKFAHHSCEYAKKFGPFPMGEDSIAKDVEAAYDYAIHILKRRFEKGEEVIAKDAKKSHNYATTIIKGRFEQGEVSIRSDPVVFPQYARYILNMLGEIPEDWHHQLIIMAFDNKNSMMDQYFNFHKSKQDEQKLRLVQHLTVEQLREKLST
jgi:hypothetical protein